MCAGTRFASADGTRKLVKETKSPGSGRSLKVGNVRGAAADLLGQHAQQQRVVAAGGRVRRLEAPLRRCFNGLCQTQQVSTHTPPKHSSARGSTRVRAPIPVVSLPSSRLPGSG